ncbi:MAG: hypothetical protein ACYDDC_08295 [Thermoplasmataceae archaeon]
MQTNRQITVVEGTMIFISFIIMTIYFFGSIKTGAIIVDTGVLYRLLFLLVMFFSLYLFQFLGKWHFPVMSAYASMIVSIVMIVILISNHTGLNSFPIVFASLLQFSYMLIMVPKVHGWKIRAPVFVGTIFIMSLIGQMFSYGSFSPGFPITVESIQAFFTAVGNHGLPLIDAYGIVYIDPPQTIVVSPFVIIMFFGVSILVTENYYEIISYVVGRNTFAERLSTTIYGLVSALSCQCESFIAFLPALAILIIDTLFLPIIFLSIGLLMGTYILVKYVYKRGKCLRIFNPEEHSKNPKMLILIMIVILFAVPVFVPMGIYLGWESSALFFFSSGMLMLLEGYITAFIIGKILSVKKSKTQAYVYIVTGTVLSFTWFIPSLVYISYNNGFYFEIMSFTGFVGGILFGFAYIVLENKWAYLVNEYLAVIFSIFPLTVYYLSITLGIDIWGVFSLASQIQYSIVAWAVMLPLMWITTQISLNSIACRNLSIT